jgi:hypothetical protein
MGMMALKTKKGWIWRSGGYGGLTTPAAALGSDLTKEILGNMDASFEIKELS